MSKTIIAGILMLASAAVAAPAKDGAKAGAEFGYFVGSWKCDEHWQKTEMWPAYQSTATLVAANNTDGVWIAWSYVQDASPGVPQPPKGNDLWGYDPAAKQFVREKADSFAPGHVTHLVSKGFVGDTIAWDGEAQTPKGAVAFRHTFKKLDDRTVEGKLFFAGHEVYVSKCTKS
ncbi:MAG TPA: hypothetical protein VGM88_09215 [Kofleriaceae bacterium]